LNTWLLPIKDFSPFPQAHAQGIRYPSHLFIMMGWYKDEWWFDEHADNISCSSADRESVLEYALTVLHFNFHIQDDISTTSGIVSAWL
jgi:hypothetical protein